MKDVLNNSVGRNRGFSLIEVILYLALLVLALVLVINVLLLVTRGQGDIGAYRLLERSGSLSLDRLVRFGAKAEAIDPNSSLGVESGDLRLIYQTATGPQTARFYLTDGRLYLETDGQSNVLTPAGVTVSRFVVYRIDTPHSVGFRAELTLTASGRANEEVVRRFYTSQVLRNSYQD